MKQVRLFELPYLENMIFEGMAEIDERNLTAHERGLRRIAKIGYMPGGSTPLGYVKGNGKYDLVIDEKEKDLVKLIFDKYLETENLNEVSRFLNNRGIKGKEGGKWSSSNVNKVLRNSFYKGIIKYGDIVAEGNHEPIIPADLFDRVQELLDENRKNAWHYHPPFKKESKSKDIRIRRLF